MGSGITRILLLVSFAAALAACGRAGDPELPPAAAAAEKDKPADAPPEDRPFILDPLI